MFNDKEIIKNIKINIFNIYIIFYIFITLLVSKMLYKMILCRRQLIEPCIKTIGLKYENSKIVNPYF